MLSRRNEFFGELSMCDKNKTYHREPLFSQGNPRSSYGIPYLSHGAPPRHKGLLTPKSGFKRVEGCDDFSDGG